MTNFQFIATFASTDSLCWVGEGMYSNMFSVHYSFLHAEIYVVPPDPTTICVDYVRSCKKYMIPQPLPNHKQVRSHANWK